MEKSLSRRSFIQGSAAAVAAGAAISSVALADEAPSWMPETWDYEADVVVVGYGGAGASAAIGAAREDPDAQVIIIEKAPEGDEGGNTSVSGGGWIRIDPEKIDESCKFHRAQVPSTVTDEEIEGFVNDVMGVTDFVNTLGVEASNGRDMPGMCMGYLEGAEGVPGSATCGGGYRLFCALRDTVNSMPNITVMNSTPAYRLIFDPVTKEVYGVKAKQGDKIVTIKANRGVVMGIGGYENNLDMIHQYCTPEVEIFPMGTPYNTGDGIPMVAEVGARLRHFASYEWGSWAFKKASEDVGTAVATSFRGPVMDNAIFVNKYAERFCNETKCNEGFCPTPMHDKTQFPFVATEQQTKAEYVNLPFYYIFDETRRAASAVADLASDVAGETWAGVHDTYVWSDDNLAEIEKGYIIQADTIAELAEKAGLDPEVLQATVDTYNAGVEAGVDEQFGRTTQLTPVSEPPFYLSECVLSFTNTQGGPDRNGSWQVIDWEDNPIPRLYAAGEFGSIYGFWYQGCGNVAEALCGRVAGANAAKLEPWC